MMAGTKASACGYGAGDRDPNPLGLGAPSASNSGRKEGAQRLHGTPSQVLENILPGDPLGLGGMLRLRLRERALFLDYDMICLRVFAQVARMAPARNPRLALGDWLRLQVETVLNGALAEARRVPLDWAGPNAATQGSATFAQLAAPLGLDPVDMGAACNRFHGLDDSVREAFFLLVLEGWSLDKAARLESLAAPRLARRARRALDVLRDLKDPVDLSSSSARQLT